MERGSLVLPAAILAFGVALGGLLLGGVYEMAPREGISTSVFRINKFTGEVLVCGVSDGGARCVGE